MNNNISKELNVISKNKYENELKELKELQLIINSDKFKKVNKTIFDKIHPIYNKVFYLYTKYIPIDTNNDDKLHSLIKELIVIKKSIMFSNYLFLLNSIFFGLLYLTKKKTNYKKLSFFLLNLFGFTYIGSNYYNYKFSVLMNILLKENINYTIYKLESGEEFYEENKKMKIDISQKLKEKEEIKKEISETQYLNNVNQKESLIEFYANWFYGPVDVELENKLYFLNESYSRESIFINMNEILKNKNFDKLGISINKI